MDNSISFRVYGRSALFSDPVTRVGGEKCSYHIPTYEALKGIVKSIYWKPTFIWHIDRMRVLKPIRTQARGAKPLEYDTGGNSLAIYTYLANVAYEVEAHFEWNPHRPELAGDRIDGKHYEIAKRMLEKGGRQDIFLGTRECQGYVESCRFGEEKSAFEDIRELAFGLMFHGFDYPDESGVEELHARFWHPVMKKGLVVFPRPEECTVRKYIRPMRAKTFAPGTNVAPVREETFV